MRPTPIGLLIPVKRHFTPPVNSLKDDSPYVRLRNGASGKYDGANVKTVGTVAAGEVQLAAIVPEQAVCKTIPGRSPPYTEPTPGKASAPLPALIGGPMVAFPTGNPNSGPDVKGRLNPKVPELPPTYGNWTNGCVPVGR